MAQTSNFDYLEELGNTTKTPAQVGKIIAADFKLRGITHAEAANRLKVSRQVVTNQLSGKRYFGNKTSQKYHTAFGYNPLFLRTGTGELIGPINRYRFGGMQSVEDVKKVHRELREVKRRLSIMQKQYNETSNLLQIEREKNTSLTRMLYNNTIGKANN